MSLCTSEQVYILCLCFYWVCVCQKLLLFFYWALSYKSREAPINFVVYVCLSACITAANIGRISVKFGIGDFHEKLSTNKSSVNFGQNFRASYTKT